MRDPTRATRADLEKRRALLHQYIIVKLDERDYHAVADAAMDLRELDVQVKGLSEQERES